MYSVNARLALLLSFLCTGLACVPLQTQETVTEAPPPPVDAEPLIPEPVLSFDDVDEVEIIVVDRPRGAENKAAFDDPLIVQDFVDAIDQNSTQPGAGIPRAQELIWISFWTVDRGQVATVHIFGDAAFVRIGTEARQASIAERAAIEAAVSAHMPPAAETPRPPG